MLSIGIGAPTVWAQMSAMRMGCFLSLLKHPDPLSWVNESPKSKIRRRSPCTVIRRSLSDRIELNAF